MKKVTKYQKMSEENPIENSAEETPQTAPAVAPAEPAAETPEKNEEEVKNKADTKESSEKNENNTETATESQTSAENTESADKKEEPSTSDGKKEEPSDSKREENAVAKLPDEPEMTDKGIPVNERSMWLPQGMEQNPEVLQFRERTRDWFGAYSFGKLKHVLFTTCSSQLDRYRVLQLIFQYLHSIGLHHVADSLSKESGLEFQRKDQNMERTDLRLLVSMSLGPRDNLWDDTGLENINISDEVFDDDNNSIRFEEKLTEGCKPEDYESEMTFQEEQPHTLDNVLTSTIHALVCALIINNEDFIRTETKNKIFSTINSICHSSHFFAHIQRIYAQYDNLQDSVLRLIDEWISFSGLFIGKTTLGAISYFLTLSDNEKAKDLIQKISKLEYGHPIKTTDQPPESIITLDVPRVSEDKLSQEQREIESKAAAKLLDPNLSLSDPVPEETARQITLVTQHLFSQINPREFYSAISTREYSAVTPGLIELYEFGKKLKKLVVNNILSGGDKDKAANHMDTAILIANKLLEMNNFESLTWFVSAFKSKVIHNLQSIYASLVPERKEEIKFLLDNFGADQKSSEYEKRIFTCIKDKKPAIPNVSYELEILGASAYGGEDFPDNKVNVQKRLTIGVFSNRFIELQNIQYNFINISQIQDVLSRGCTTPKEKIIEYSIAIESPIKTDEDIVTPSAEVAPEEEEDQKDNNDALDDNDDINDDQ